MSTDDFELLLTKKGDVRPIRNLWPLYLHDISANDDRAPFRVPRSGFDQQSLSDAVPAERPRLSSHHCQEEYRTAGRLLFST